MASTDVHSHHISTTPTCEKQMLVTAPGGTMAQEESTAQNSKKMAIISDMQRAPFTEAANERACDVRTCPPPP